MPKKALQISDRYVHRAYLSPSNVGALGGVSKFANARKIKDYKELEASLNKIPAFTKHRPARTNIERRPIIVKNPGELIQADLIDMQKHKRKNKNFAYILIAVDAFTKYAVAVPIKTKGAKHMLEGFEQLIKGFKFKIRACQSDNGLEFFNKLVKGFLKANGIEQYATFSALKAQMASEKYVFKTFLN